MEIQTVITVVLAVMSSASFALKYIAPLTQNKIDDNVHKFLVKLLRFLSQDSNFAKYKKQILVK